jgi:hypothetical protein
MSALSLSVKIDYERLQQEHDEFSRSIQEGYSEEAKQAFLADPKSVWIQWTTETREEALTSQWNEKVLRAQESLARKAKRLDAVQTAYARERWFQDEHASVNTVFDGKILCGFYKVFRILSSDDGRPMHFEFVLKRSTHVLGNEIPAMVRVPLTTMMGVGAWSEVTLSKITVKEEEHHDDYLCSHCGCALSECPEGGDHGDQMRDALKG